MSGAWSSQAPSAVDLSGEGGEITGGQRALGSGHLTGLGTGEDPAGREFSLLLSCRCENLSIGQTQPGARGQGCLWLHTWPATWSEEQGGKAKGQVGSDPRGPRDTFYKFQL